MHFFQMTYILRVPWSARKNITGPFYLSGTSIFPRNRIDYFNKLKISTDFNNFTEKFLIKFNNYRFTICLPKLL